VNASPALIRATMFEEENDDWGDMSGFGRQIERISRAAVVLLIFFSLRHFGKSVEVSLFRQGRRLTGG
jgi:hypothetical protein